MGGAKKIFKEVSRPFEQVGKEAERAAKNARDEAERAAKKVREETKRVRDQAVGLAGGLLGMNKPVAQDANTMEAPSSVDAVSDASTEAGASGLSYRGNNDDTMKGNKKAGTRKLSIPATTSR